MLARKLLPRQLNDEDKIKAVLEFLTSESGSHDYTINRREARDELGLKIDNPDDEEYAVIKAIYDDVVDDLDMHSTFEPNLILGEGDQAHYTAKRAFIESVDGGSHYFSTQGTARRQILRLPNGVTQAVIQDTRTYEGWRHAQHQPADTQ